MRDEIDLKINYRSEVEFNEKREAAKLGKANYLALATSPQGDLNRRMWLLGFRTLCCDVFGLLKN